MITRQDNFLSSKDCDYIINWHKAYWPDLHTDYKKFYNKTECVRFIKLLGQPDHCPNIFKKLFSDLSAYIKTIDKELFINYTEIVRWPEGEQQLVHKDFNYHPYTSILYLNDDYEGGQTKVFDEIVQPKKGTLITFKGADVMHGVLKIKKGERYTMPVWYSTLSDVKQLDKSNER